MAHAPSVLVFSLSLLLLFAACAGAATHYVSTTGNDANPGTVSAPFLTIQKCADIATPGDTCMVREGVYRETVKPARSGASGQPITFRASPGETVTVSGADAVIGWSLHQGAIHKASVPWAVQQVFVDGQMMTEARWPNTGSDLFHPTLAHAGPGTGRDATTGIETVSDPALKFPAGYWDDAVIWISAISQWSAVAWWAQTQRVAASGDGFVRFASLPIDPVDPHHTRIPGPGNGYYLTGKLAALDAPTEWFHDGATSTLYLWTPQGDAPSRHVVDVKRRDFAFDLSGLAYITVKDFNIFAATITMRDARHCIVDHVNVKYVSHFRESLPNAWGVNYDRAIDRQLWTLAGVGYSGIIMTGSDNQLVNSQIAYSSHNGVVAWGDKHRIENNIVHHVNYSGGSMAGIYANGSGIVIRRNTVHTAGREIVLGQFLKRSSVELNDLSNGMLLTTDGGIFYTQRVNGEGTTIAYNWIHDTAAGEKRHGVYLDNAAGGFTIHHNAFWNIPGWCVTLNPQSLMDPGGVMYTGDGNAVYNNSFYNCGQYDVSMWVSTSPDVRMSTINIANNAFTGGVRIFDGVVAATNLFPPADPRFKAPAQGDLRLRADSPAIDAGRVIPNVTDGYRGRAPDIGAYELGDSWKPGATIAFPDVFPYPAWKREPSL
jgi:Right handed beta helix region